MDSINILLITAASTGFIHALLGPDHYLPFIFLSKARKWNFIKTMFITFCCGVGHLASTVVISFAGMALGFSFSKIEAFDSIRGGISGWIFFLFGLSYMIWGIHKAIKNKPHTHFHSHGGGELHTHNHLHDSEHTHQETKAGRLLTPWVLFIIFVLGPCEILIPQVLIPATHYDKAGILAIVALFSIATITTMCAAVAVGYYGFNKLPTAKIERYMHAISGAIICLSGFAILFFDM